MTELKCRKRYASSLTEYVAHRLVQAAGAALLAVLIAAMLH
jgi:hypothetical protein